jgi:UDP-N-acetylmuramyl pentapeptide phosphotransferase/UDP-N-acetylglucosamine-1-phosphate transferase
LGYSVIANHSGANFYNGSLMLAAAVSFLCALVVGHLALSLALNRFANFASAVPGQRSNHDRPTPQIGGIALIPTVLLVAVATPMLYQPLPVFSRPEFFGAALILLGTGIIDDTRPLAPLPKLALQFVACGLASIALHDVLPPLPLPPPVASAVVVLFLVAIVNLTNFIDGLDLMAVSTIGVPSLLFACLAAVGGLSAGFGPLGAAVGGAMLAFAGVNRPRAKAFLGDGGSLPFGLMLGMMSIVVACQFDPIAGLLLPAYILFDGVFTIARRLAKGENILQAHSSHIYQRAYRNGRSIPLIALATALFGGLTGLLAITLAEFGNAGRVGAVALATGVFALMAVWLVNKR